MDARGGVAALGLTHRAGADKAEAVAAALAPGADRWEVPAAGVRGTDATLWLVDADAASALG